MLAALYARYSTDHQRSESIAAQFRYASEYCKQHGYTVVKKYKDEAFSGTNDRRPGFQRMLEDAEKGLFDVVVMHKVDRAARNEYDYYTNMHRLHLAGVRVEYAGTSFDSSTPEGLFMEAQLVGMAAYYSRNLSGEIKKGQRENFFEGKCTNGSLCYGYKTGARNYIIIDEERASAVRYAFRAYAEGATYSEIKRWLHEHGYRTARGNDFSSTALHDMFKNPRYIGTAILGHIKKDIRGKRNSHAPMPKDALIKEDALPAIIDKELWKKVQERMEKNKRLSGSGRKQNTYLLTGLIYCGECGSAMTGTVIRKGHSDYRKRYYRCNKKHRHLSGVCRNTFVDADALEAIVKKRLVETMLSEDFIAHLVKDTQDAYSHIVGHADEELAALRPKQKKLRRSMNAIYEIIEDGRSTKYDVERLRDVQAELAGVEESIERIEKKRDVCEVSEADVRRFIHDRFIPYVQKKSADNDIRALLEEFVEKLVVDRDKITIRYKFACDWCVRQDSNPRPTA